MNNFLVAFKDKWHLREVWEAQFSSGVVFLATPAPFTQGTEFKLALRVEEPQVGLLILARVVQVLQAEGSQGKGMVAEFLSYSEYRRDLNELIADLDDRHWVGVRDFSNSQKPQASVEQVALIRKITRYLELTKDKNFYEVLDLDPAASMKKVQDQYLKMSRDFHPDSQSAQMNDALSALLDEAYQRVTRAYAVLKDRASRSRYDLTQNILVRAIDETQSNFKMRKLQYKIEANRDHNRETITKAERLFQHALEAERKGEIEAARKNIKLALLHDPNDPRIRKKKEELDKKET